VDFISHADTKAEKLPSWERPDVLLGKKNARWLEGYLRIGWRAAGEMQGTPLACGRRQDCPRKQTAQQAQATSLNQPQPVARKHKEKKEKSIYVQKIRTGVWQRHSVEGYD
jgi:hypothetical protein